MGQVGDKLRKVANGFAHWCPACDMPHIYTTHRPTGAGPLWTFNGDLVRPTFEPSMRCSWGDARCCHYFVRGGKIEFCSDSTHQLAGQTVELPDLPDEMKDWVD